MSIKTTVIVEGALVRVSSREIVSTKDGPNKGKKFTFTNMLIVGPDCMASVRLQDNSMELPKTGAQVRLVAEVSSYRDDDEITFSAWLG